MNASCRVDSILGFRPTLRSNQSSNSVLSSPYSPALVCFQAFIVERMAQFHSVMGRPRVDDALLAIRASVVCMVASLIPRRALPLGAAI